MKKYPRTYHYSFSQEIHSDDKVFDSSKLNVFLDNEIIITEKMDGGNTCLKPNVGVFARTHSLPTNHESFNYIKNIHYYSKLNILNKDYWYFGENMFAIHSIEYSKLNDYFYIFNILDKKNHKWLSWEDIKKECIRCNFKLVPLKFKGKVKSIKEIQQFCEKNIILPSSFGNNCEGFVVRNANSFNELTFSDNIAKFVRKNHVQSDEHWSLNWKPQTKLKI